MKRRQALGLVAGATALPACTKVGGSSTAEGGRHSWTIPHVLRYADNEDPASLNPVVTAQASTKRLAQLWAAWLFRYDENYDPVPELATEVPTVENGLLSRDGRRIVFRLRQAVWSDGTPLTSKDLAFSVALILNPATNVTSRDGWDKIERVETPDDRTAIFHMKELFTAFVPTFFTTGGANPCILPEHVVLGQDPNQGPYNAQPIGAGPFVVDRWERGQRVVLTPNPRYWRGKPQLERIVYKIIQNADTIVTQLHAHELDLWVQMGSNYLNQVVTIPGTTIIRGRSQSWIHFDCNCSHPGLSEIPVRKALNHAIDRQTIIEKALHGVGEIKWAVLSPNSYAYNPAVRRYPFDLPAAAALLDRAGYRMGPDGVRHKGTVKLHLNFGLMSGDPAWAEMVELVRATWRQIGVTFDIKTYPASLYFAQYQNGGIVYRGKFDVCAFTWGDTPAPTDMLTLYASDQTPPNGQNDLQYRNAEVTQLLHAARRTLDRRAQTRMLQRVQAIVADECPSFPLVQNVDLHQVNVDLQNFRPCPSGPFDFMMNVDI